MAKDQTHTHGSQDPFLRNYQPSELIIASEFFITWLPFLTKDLCKNCTMSLSDRIRSIHPESNNMDESLNCDLKSIKISDNHDDNCDKSSTCESCLIETPSPRMSWADMAQEDEFGEEEFESKNNSSHSSVVTTTKTSSEKSKLSREQREHIRFKNVQCKKDFVRFERIKGRVVNIIEGLELHYNIFSAAEQRRIVSFVTSLQEMGKKGQLKDRTYSAPQKWMRGKGRQTIQFGCCYNYAKDKDGNPPGILNDLSVIDPMPDLFKVMIRRLIRWHVLPPTCVPDSCIVNVYEEGDCIPPHVDNHDFVRPFCTVSFLSECDILFGSNLKVVGPGEFAGSIPISLPVGSVLVLNGNGADVAKHCVPAVPTKRISITFRRMDVSKRPSGYVEEPDLQGIQPLVYESGQQAIQPPINEADKERRSNGSVANYQLKRQTDRRGSRIDSPGSAMRGGRFSEPRGWTQRPTNRWSKNPINGRMSSE
ncbi:hypothetical protein Lal_00004840 [Lupinus albus]|uniref:Putative oxoglutarate/iron-dependent dioxygenase, alpha-ketoglutarate-dependent dioxygenase AlkB n=1 Tax=Lupinus albus TaxID=3870 RepID=A0A6A4N305_LUPAL|nr:putative oxoglutarate/iron-dependent dioxygenase, alpha-ketoglutarate-dependent dioxygenase AlkB [Lupinus albus]KAF1865465.1 hypothetical protein Lal_00004840 [Lupinus albus]